MYCGSCMHENRLAAALRAQGHDVVLVPLYTPLRTDETDISLSHVYYGGINAFLQQSSTVFRHTPWFVDRLLDAGPLLRLVGRFAGSTRPETLGAMTLSVLKGEHGRQRKELAKLIAGLRQLAPDLVHLPNLMFVGVAEALREALGVPVLCALAGEDVFIDRLPEPYRGQVFELIRGRAPAVAAFDAVTEYYARHATAHFGLPAERVHRLPLAIHAGDFAAAGAPAGGPFTIGYLAHVCAEKGLLELARAFVLLRKQGRACRLRVAGYLGPADKAYLAQVEEEVRQAGIGGGEFEYVGEVDRAGKLEFLASLQAFSVPTAYAEAKGFFVLEALAAGVPVVEPRHGAFPELIAATEGGLLYEAGQAEGLADALARLMDDERLRCALGARGREVVLRDFTAERLAAQAWALYERIVCE